MKILMLAPQPFFVERGTPIAVRLAVAALCAAGHQVDLVVFHEGEDIEIPGLRLIRIARPPGVEKVGIGLSLGKLVSDLWLGWRAFGRLRRERYDVVHAVEESVFLALAARAFWRFRLVYDMDSLMSQQIADKSRTLGLLLPLMRALEKWAVRRADLLLPVCQAIADEIEPCAAPGRLVVLPDVAFSPDPRSGQQLVERLPRRGDACLVLYVGNLEAYQGIDLLFDAMRRLGPDGPCSLVVVGGGAAEVKRWQEQTKQEGLDGTVLFLGPRPLDQLSGLLAQADILCSPRLTGVNTPMKIYSYMASGRAVVATDIVSHSQVLDETMAKLVPVDGQAMANAFATLAADPLLRDELGEAAALTCQRHYTEQAFHARLLQAYAILDERPSPSVAMTG